MKQVFIKYNPYQVTTEILIDGKEIKKIVDSMFRINVFRSG